MLIPRSKKPVSRKADPPEGNDGYQKAEKAQVVLSMSPRPGSVKTVVPHGVTREGYAVP